MKREKLLKELTKHFDRIDKEWFKIKEIINEVADEQEGMSYNDMLGYTEIDSRVDGLALNSAWIRDRLNGKNSQNRGTMVKKIRKALGYTYP